jgi:Fe-S-cluster containining protein
MTLDDRNTIVANTTMMADDIFRTIGKTNEAILLLVKNLYRYGEKLTRSIEDEKGITDKIACKKGCSHCCYAQVSLTPPEAFFIVQFIRENYSLRKKDQLVKRVSKNIRLTKDKSLDERVEVWHQTPCIFLEDGICSIHEVRPFICRAWHSLSAEQCLNALNSGDKEAEIDTTPYRNTIYGAIRQGLSEATDHIGCESDPIIITHAIKVILNHPAPEAAWLSGETLFGS